MVEENRQMIGPAFEDIRNLRGYLTAVDGCLAGANLQLAKILDDLKKILTAKDTNDLSHVLHYEISSETERQIGFARGYTPTISITRLIALLEKVAAEYTRQQDMSKTNLIKLLKQQERLILDQEQQKKELQDNINDILEFTKTIAFAAKDKARITARASKQRFEAARGTIDTILERRRSNPETPEDVDTDKLRRVYYQRPEEYYK